MDHALTELQLAILAVLWEHGDVGVADIHDELRRERRIAQTTVATLLSRLEERGIVGRRKVDRQYLYRSRVSRSEVRHSMVREFTDATAKLFQGDVAGLVSALVSEREADADEIARAREVLAQRERELRQKERGA
ncbi:MAG TPA: BlaI/MecI/CopY family transcriptional regulator [Longimicrobiales bacterium]|nr:BlaI/MecI/CopY family transcriptional regulator [Longimicrobiales bacterium]